MAEFLSIPWMEEPGRLQSMGLQRVRCDLATKQQQRAGRESVQACRRVSRITVAVGIGSRGRMEEIFRRTGMPALNSSLFNRESSL